MAGTLKVDSIENLAGNGYVTTAGNTSIDASGATTSIKLPRGTTAQRPSNAPAGSVRFNTDNDRLEYYDGTVWRNGDGSSSQTTMTRDGDPYWKNVVLLIQDGAKRDFSDYGHGVTSNGSATPVSDVPFTKANGATQSWHLGHNTSSWLRYDSQPEQFALGRHGTWTVEFWVKDLNTSDYAHYFVPGGQNAQGTFKSSWSGGNNFRPYFYNSGGNAVGYSDSTSYGVNTWHHVVYERSHTALRIWINGTRYMSSTNGNNINDGVPSSGSIYSGYWSGEAQPFYIDELRVTIGVNRYGDVSSIPIQTESWPRHLGTQSGGSGDGTSPESAAKSALQILALNPSAPSKDYWIDVNGTPRKLYCDMSMDKGGWTLIGKVAGRENRYQTWLISNTNAGELVNRQPVTGSPAHACIDARQIASEATEICLSSHSSGRWVKSQISPLATAGTLFNHQAGPGTVTSSEHRKASGIGWNGGSTRTYVNPYCMMGLSGHGGMYPHFGVNTAGNTAPSDYAMAVGAHQSGTIVTPSGNWSGNGNGWDAPDSETNWPNSSYNNNGAYLLVFVR